MGDLFQGLVAEDGFGSGVHELLNGGEDHPRLLQRHGGTHSGRDDPVDGLVTGWVLILFNFEGAIFLRPVIEVRIIDKLYFFCSYFDFPIYQPR